LGHRSDFKGWLPSDLATAWLGHQNTSQARPSLCLSLRQVKATA
jgi:hypothetical protein